MDREGLSIGIADLNDRSRLFFKMLGLRRLSGICGAGQVSFGPEAPAIRWFDAAHRAELLAHIQSDLLVSAVYRLAGAFHHRSANLVSGAAFRGAVAAIGQLKVFDAITREYDLHGLRVPVSVEVGARDGMLGIVRPKTKLDIQQLVAQALAELVGFTQVADARLFAAAIVPLLLCQSPREIGVFLARQGVVPPEDVDLDIDYDSEAIEHQERTDLVDDAFAGILSGLTKNPAPAPTPSPAAPPSSPTPPPEPAPALAAPFELPPLDTVEPVHESVSNTTIAGKPSGGGGWSGSSGSSSWRRPEPADVERDNKVGARGEELVYREELKRVRALGHGDPEQLVVWTSRTNPGADHDMRSIDAEGRAIWIEVKSTTGSDGYFIWSRREFERAVAAGPRYQLWRVYDAASTQPKLKCFPDPVRLLETSQLSLDLGDLKANIEGSG
jgi:hypothetical protein